MRNRDILLRLAGNFAASASNMDSRLQQARETPEMKAYRESRVNFANDIVTATENAKSVEALVYIEMLHQDIDERNAKTAKDKTSVENAKREYKQILETLGQMRKRPDQYFSANLSIKETRGDFKKMPRSRGLQQLDGNMTRLENRSSFASEEDLKVWDARIALVGKTKSMLKTLHNDLVAKYERKLKMQEQSGSLE
jgi:hypothetical protein